MRERGFLPIGLAIAALATVTASTAAAADLKTGDVIDQTTWQKAEGLLPPEVLRHYKDGDYVNKFVDWPMSKTTIPPDFKAGSEANEGRFATTPEGSIVDKATGKQPPYIIGYPFPTIDEKDPAAGIKIVWNYFYRYYYYGNLLAESQLNWLNPKGLDRRADAVASFCYYDGVPRDELPGANPDNYLFRSLYSVIGPADLNGTAALAWRYRDSRRDSTWAYVPALRRVRATSPANRSDGFLGSDTSEDDGPFFDGKPEDFVWKLVGQTDQLRFSDERNLKGQAKAVWSESKGAWNLEWPDIPYVGYMDPNWKGIAWAPTGGAALSTRRHWIVEGVPRDRYYLYGKIQLYIDTASYQGAWSRKFGWRDELLAVHQVMAWDPMPNTRPDGKVDYTLGSNQAYQTVENLRMNRATVAGIKSSPTAGFYMRIKFDPNIFRVDALAREGK